MNYHKIEKTSVANGTGVRVVLWVSGCSLHCRGCHNPETWSLDSGQLFDEKAKIELFEALDKPYIQGITFSGGHPLENENVYEVYNLIIDIKDKFPDKDIWLYTGYIFNDIINCPLKDMYTTYRRKIISMCDIVVDGPFIEAEKDLTLKWCGSRNQRVINCRESIKENKIILYKE
jgi:anaerobic ribonucleoside-triphosphate reductase activating protein